MCTFDILIIAILSLTFIYGLYKGLIEVLSGIVAFVVGIYIAVNFSYYIEEQLSSVTQTEYVGIIAFVATLILAIIGIHLLSKVVSHIVDITILSIPNRILGGLFASVATAIIISSALTIANNISDTGCIVSQQQRNESILYNHIENIAPTLLPIITHIGSSN